MTALGQHLLNCHASLYRYARALCHDPVDADELVQETYRRALAAKRKPGAAAENEIRRWLFTIMRHIWQNDLRRRSHDADARGIELGLPGIADSPDAILSRKLLQSEIRQAIDSLPVVFREVIVLREIEDLSYNEIAHVLQCAPGTVMSRLARGRSMLRRALAAAGVVPYGVTP
jgi:RNA polymerase sigma-70 factor (ECF subfamily)